MVENEQLKGLDIRCGGNCIDPSDLAVNLGDEVNAVAETNDAKVFEVQFRRIKPSVELARSFGVGSVNEPLSSAQDAFAPHNGG